MALTRDITPFSLHFRPGLSGSVSHRSRPQSTRVERLQKKRLEQREQLDEAAQELLNHFNHRNMDALLKSVRFTLENLRKRISASAMSSYVKATSKNEKQARPFFACYAVLAIPNVVMQPALDEVQQAVNKAAHLVISVSKGVSQWNKERRTGA